MSLGVVPTTAQLTPGLFDELSRITRLLNAAEPRVLRTFLESVDAVANLESLELVAARLEVGDLAGALEATASIPESLAITLEAAFTSAGLSAAEVLRSQTGSLFQFNTISQRAVSALQESRLRLVAEFTSQQLAATETILTQAIAQGLAPIEQARLIRGSIGLTNRQAQSVENFRRLLEDGSSQALQRKLRDRRFDASIRRAISGERPLTTAQIDRQVERYRERMIDFRARTIARTETLRAINEGDEELWNQAVEAGEIDPADIENVWHTAADERVRSSHRFMNGQRRGFQEPFRSGNGNALRFPGDPRAPRSDVVNCRCVVARGLRDPEPQG